MKIAIVGSRKLSVSNEEISRNLSGITITAIISGGAKGVDQCAARFAREMGIPLIEIKPDYKRFGRKAPLIRNGEIAQAADLCLAFGETGGTSHAVSQFKKAGKKVIQISNPKQRELW